MQLPLEFESYSFRNIRKVGLRIIYVSLLSTVETSETWVNKYLTISAIYRNTTRLFKLNEIFMGK